jgi:hypothetical protein
MSYIEQPFDEATKEKWAAGQLVYGPTFVGEPAEQLYEEALDSWNYCEEMLRWGYPEQDVRLLMHAIRFIGASAQAMRQARAQTVG